MHQTGEIPNQFENGQFSMEVNDSTQAGPALRHSGGACILFVAGNAEKVVLKSFRKNLWICVVIFIAVLVVLPMLSALLHWISK